MGRCSGAAAACPPTSIWPALSMLQSSATARTAGGLPQGTKPLTSKTACYGRRLSVAADSPDAGAIFRL